VVYISPPNRVHLARLRLDYLTVTTLSRIFCFFRASPAVARLVVGGFCCLSVGEWSMAMSLSGGSASMTFSSSFSSAWMLESSMCFVVSSVPFSSSEQRTRDLRHAYCSEENRVGVLEPGGV
jgi:hypothetical protein